LHKRDLKEFVLLANKVRREISISIGLEVNDIIPVKKIPKTTSGKIQRYKLVENYIKMEYVDVLEQLNSLMREFAGSKNSCLPKNEVEEKILSICAEVLGSNLISVNDNFIEYGASSIILAQIHEKLEQLFPGKIKVTDLFVYPSISKLAEFILSKSNITIEQIVMPKEYFNSNPGQKDLTTFEASLKDQLYDGIMEVSKVENVEPIDIILAAYYYLIFELSENDRITIQVAVESLENIVHLNVNEFSNFSELFKTAHKKTKNSFSEGKYSIGDIENINLQKDSNSIIPLFLKYHLSSINSNILEVFDIILQVDVEQEKIMILLEYNNRLQKYKMNEFFNTFIKLIKIIVSNYNSDSEVATCKN
jgi:surfactin family lipopeptide synthetase A